MNKLVALITGGSRGIGLGIARELADNGWSLALNGTRSLADVENVIKEFRDKGVDVFYSQGDIGQAEDRKQILQKTLVHFGHVNTLINNAGIAPKERNDLLDMSEESFDRVMNVNLRGTFFLSQIVAKAMITSKGADPNFLSSIVNISSISATTASVNRGQYCISKAGIGMVTKLFATRLGAYSIPVFEVRPGIIATDMTDGVKKKYDRLFSDGLGITSRWGEVEDVAKVVLPLVRGDFHYSTGQVIMVDGGMNIQRL